MYDPQSARSSGCSTDRRDCIADVRRRAPGARALDIGCGTGAMSFRLASHGFDVIGLDHSPDMLAIAQEKASSSGMNGVVRFVLGDAEELPFPDAGFDVVTCEGVLHHLVELTPCVDEIARTMAPGGLVYIAEPCTSPHRPDARRLGAPALRRVGIRRGQRAALSDHD